MRSDAAHQRVDNHRGATRDRAPRAWVPGHLAKGIAVHVPPIPHLTAEDPQLAMLIEGEAARQHDKLRMIPSENYVSEAVLEATGTVLTNKYSEGYATKRYYEGQQFVDPIEQLAVARATELFGVDHANVQPYSGSPANLAVYLAFATPGDTFLSLELAHGGHLTHGSPVSATGKWFHPVHYGVDQATGRIDMNRVREIALAERPKMIFCGGTAIPRTIDFPAFAEIAREVDALLVADIAHIAGLIVGGAHPSPVGYANVISTTTHKTLRGPRGAMLMCDEEYATAIDKAVFPGLQGGPHNHTTAGIAVALREAAQPSFRDYAHQIVANAKALAAALTEHGFDLVSGGTDNHLILIDLTNKGDQRQAGGEGTGRGRHRAELQHRAVRSAQAVEPVRHPARHAGAHHAGPDRGAHAPGRGVDGRRDHGRRQGRRRRAGEHRRCDLRAAVRLPDAGLHRLTRAAGR